MIIKHAEPLLKLQELWPLKIHDFLKELLLLSFITAAKALLIFNQSCYQWLLEEVGESLVSVVEVIETRRVSVIFIVVFGLSDLHL